MDRLKLCFNIKLIGSSAIQISSVAVDNKIWEYQNMVFFICSDGYLFEKSVDNIRYTPYRLIMPANLNEKYRKLYCTYTFVDDKMRYEYLKKLKNNLLEFTKSGFFGYNPKSRVLTYKNFWFVY